MIIQISFRRSVIAEVDFRLVSQCVGKKACVSYSTMEMVMLF